MLNKINKSILALLISSSQFVFAQREINSPEELVEWELSTYMLDNCEEEMC